MATDQWTVKDILCHIVYWHENYTSNYQALAKKLPPPLLDGPGYKLNQEGVTSLRKFSETELIARLHKANNILRYCIIEKQVPKMTYKKDGHIYNTEDFLHMVARHLMTHTIQVRRAK
jgi:hypothetical protein